MFDKIRISLFKFLTEIKLTKYVDIFYIKYLEAVDIDIKASLLYTFGDIKKTIKIDILFESYENYIIKEVVFKYKNRYGNHVSKNISSEKDLMLWFLDEYRLVLLETWE